MEGDHEIIGHRVGHYMAEDSWEAISLRPNGLTSKKRTFTIGRLLRIPAVCHDTRPTNKPFSRKQTTEQKTFIILAW
jgi:hypothetical protein